MGDKPIMRQVKRSNSQVSLGLGSPLSPTISASSSPGGTRRVRLQDFGLPGSPTVTSPVRLRRGRSNSTPNLNNWKSNHWQLLSNIIFATSHLKKRVGNVRKHTNRQHFYKYIDDVSTCSKCSKKHIADTDWYRCNICLHTHVDLCRQCFRNWNHPQHWFSEMSQASYTMFHKRIKRRWYILRLGMRSEAIRPLIDRFHSKIIAHLIQLLTPSADEPSGVLKNTINWCLAIPHLKKLLTGNKQTSLAAFYWKGGKAGFARPLTPEAKQKLVDYLREQDNSGRERITISDASSNVDLADGSIKIVYEDNPVEFIVAGGASNSKLFCKFPKRDPFRVTKVLLTDVSKPNSVVILGPPKMSLKLPWGLTEQDQRQTLSILTTLRSITKVFDIVCTIPESLLLCRNKDNLKENGSISRKKGLHHVINRNILEGYSKTAQQITAMPGSVRQSNVQQKEMWNSSSKIDDRHHRGLLGGNTPAHLELIHLKGIHSLWEDTTPAVIHILRTMMNGLVDALKIVTNQKQVRTANSSFNVFEGLVPDNCHESLICKEVVDIVRNYNTNGKGMLKITSDSSTETKTQSGQWDSLQGWEACHHTSRLRSGRVCFENSDMTCSATTRHDTVALGKQIITTSSISTVVTYKIIESSEDMFLGITPTSSGPTVFDSKTFPIIKKKDTPNTFSGIFYKGAGVVCLPGVSSEAVAENLVSSTPVVNCGDVLKFRVKPSLRNGFIKITLNGQLIFHRKGISFPKCGLTPYVLFRSSPRCRVQISKIEAPNESRKKLVSDPLSTTPPAVLRMLRVMESTFFNHFDRSLRRPPPRDQVTLVFTDVQSSTVLWDKSPDGMKIALALHNSVLRRLIEKWRGYEVKTEGDAFMIAFQRTEHALNWCLDSQRELLKINWPEEVLTLPAASVVNAVDGTPIFRGLRVRMGFHTGEPECEQDPVTGRMDYFGPMVNLAARISGVGQGGETVIGGAAFRHLHRNGSLPDSAVHLYCHGSISLKGITRNENLFSLLPMELKERVDYWEKKDKTVQTVFETNTKKVQDVIQQAVRDRQKTPTAAGTATTTTTTKYKSDQDVSTPEVPGLTPLTSDTSLSSSDTATECKKTNWVRTVWRQAVKMQLEREKDHDSQKNSITDTREVKIQTEPLLHSHVDIGSNRMQESIECLLMSMHEGQHVTLCDFNSDASRLNGCEGVVAGYDTNMVFVETTKFGQVSIHKDNLIKSSVKTPVAEAQTQTRILRSTRVSLMESERGDHYDQRVSTRSRGGSMGSTTSEISYHRKKSRSPREDNMRPVQKLLSNSTPKTPRSPINLRSPLSPVKEVSIVSFNIDEPSADSSKGTHSQQIAELESHITTLKGNIKKLEEEIQSPTKNSADNSYIKQLEEEIKSMKERYKTTTTGSGRVAVLEKKLSTTNDKLQEADKHSILLKKSISDLQNKLSKNQEKDSSINAENKNLKEKIAEQDESMRSLKKNASMTLRRLEAEELCTELRKKNSSLQELITKQEKEIISLQHVIKQLKESNSTTVTIDDKSNTNYTEILEGRAREFDSKEASYKLLITSLRNAETNYEKLISSLRKQLVDSNNKLSAVEALPQSPVKNATPPQSPNKSTASPQSPIKSTTVCRKCEAVEITLQRVADVSKRETELAVAQKKFEELRHVITTVGSDFEGSEIGSPLSLCSVESVDASLRAKLKIASTSTCQNCLGVAAGFARLEQVYQQRSRSESPSHWQSGELGQSPFKFPEAESLTRSLTSPQPICSTLDKKPLGSQSSDHAFRMAAGGKVLRRTSGKPVTAPILGTNLTMSISDSLSSGSLASPSGFIAAPSFSAVRMQPVRQRKRRTTLS